MSSHTAETTDMTPVRVTLHLLGHTFRPMTPDDYEGLAGAPDNSFICYPQPDSAEGVTLVASPVGVDTDGSAQYVVTELTYDGHERVWTSAVVH